MKTSKPYAFIQFATDGQNGKERIARDIKQDGLEPSEFLFVVYSYLPLWLRDSFSLGFEQLAKETGVDIIVTVALGSDG